MTAERGGGNSSCLVCGSRELVSFCAIRNVPVLANVLCPTREEALRLKRGDINLAFCRACGYIRNTAYDPVLVEYRLDYENALHFSERFRAYAEGLAARLVETYALRGKNIVEIGCGDGQFLALLCALGDNRGLGFDPSHDPHRLGLAASDRIRFIADRYSARYAHLPVDFICCRHVLEHVPDPEGFLREIRNTIGSAGMGAVYFEVPNALFTLRDLGIWDLLYEHCSYFCEPSLRRAFSLAGFKVLETRADYGDQFLGIEASPVGELEETTSGVREDVGSVASLVERFGAAYRERVAGWRERLRTWKDEGRRAVVWGSGSKGVMFLNTLKTAGAMEYVVDINPRKHGMHVAGTGQRIVPPGFLCEYQPDVIVIMNPLYEKEIRRIAGEVGVRADFLAV